MGNMAPLAATYTDARDRFRAAVEGSAARFNTFSHPSRGLDGEDLAIDVAVVGREGSSSALALVSGTHGVEGFTGSALQSHWLENNATDLPDDVAVVLLHALNPYGFSWVRRVNEDNVDLNRNFVDWAKTPPANERYGGVASLLVPESWDEATQEDTTKRLFDEVLRVGMEEFQEVVSGGQYSHPTGIFYGGAGPVWSHRWLVENLATFVAGASRVGIVDLHTGLGPSGHGELISHAGGDDPGLARARGWWGDVRSMSDGESVSAALTGDWLGRVEHVLEGCEVTAAALEFGTVDPITVLQSLRADAWLHAHGDPVGESGSDIRAQVRAAFADDDPEWLHTVTARFDQVVNLALTNLATR